MDSRPAFLKLQIVKPVRNLRSNVAPRLVKPSTTNTFHYSAANVFNPLPVQIRNCLGYKKFCAMGKDYFRERALFSF